MVVASMLHDWPSSEPGSGLGRGSGRRRWDAPGMVVAGVVRMVSGRGGAAAPVAATSADRVWVGLGAEFVCGAGGEFDRGRRCRLVEPGLGFPPFRGTSSCLAGTTATLGLGGRGAGACRGWPEG